jgi:Cu(I)/Ag(I) efflux system membrane fusion protein
MKLVPIKEGQSAATPTSTASADKTAHIKPGQYYCPMHPEVVRDSAGTCPICNMQLIQKREPGHAGHDSGQTGEHSVTATSVPGRISIAISPEKRQLIGLTLATVAKRDLTRNIRTSALVEHDETRYTKISPRFAGWVRKLHINYTGAPVAKGEPLFSVYSPELFSTESEYLVAWQSAQQLNEDASPAQKISAASLLEAARLRLSLFQIGDEEIRELEQRGKPSPELLFRAPLSGHVIVKNAVEGAAFQAGDSLYEISDLSHVWLKAYVFEYELPLISLGQDAVIRFPYLDKTFNAEVTFIYPHIEPQTRRAQVRLELENEGHVMRPDMWANVELQVKAADKLAIPNSAVINTGERYVAFVEGGDGHLEPRDVKVGMKTEDLCEVLSGLKEGEQVVDRALFLVDSESQLKAAIAGMTSGGSHQH